MKKIGIIGSGAVAKALATGFLKHGFEVMVGTRTISKLSDWHAKNPAGKTGSFEDAASFGELLVLSVKGLIAQEVLQLIGKDKLIGKTVIDTTNPIVNADAVNGVLPYFTDINFSLMEELQSAHPEANFVKCFNSVGNAFMVNPDFGGIKPSMFICGNNDAAKQQVKEILDKFGWEPEDMGKVEAARAIEPLCMLWCIPGFLENRWTHAFKLLKK